MASCGCSTKGSQPLSAEGCGILYAEYRGVGYSALRSFPFHLRLCFFKFLFFPRVLWRTAFEKYISPLCSHFSEQSTFFQIICSGCKGGGLIQIDIFLRGSNIFVDNKVHASLSVSVPDGHDCGAGWRRCFLRAVQGTGVGVILGRLWVKKVHFIRFLRESEL